LLVMRVFAQRLTPSHYNSNEPKHNEYADNHRDYNGNNVGRIRSFVLL
jgi:hypothetical protein